MVVLWWCLLDSARTFFLSSEALAKEDQQTLWYCAADRPVPIYLARRGWILPREI